MKWKLTEAEYQANKERYAREAVEMEAKLKAMQAKAEATMAKPWKEMTWKERLFKGSVYTAIGTAGVVAAGAASIAASPGTSSSPRRAAWDAGWNSYNVPTTAQRIEEMQRSQLRDTRPVPVFMPMRPLVPGSGGWGGDFRPW